MTDSVRQVMEKFRLITSVLVWLFSNNEKSNAIRWAVLLIICIVYSHLDKLGLYKYVDSVTHPRFFFEDPKAVVQQELLDLNKACGKGCFGMLISILERNGYVDGKPYSVFGYIAEIDQIVEISSMERSNPVNSSRFSIASTTYRDLVQSGITGAKVLSVEQINQFYPDIANMLRYLKADIGSYLYFVQFYKGLPIWILGIAVQKDFIPRCSYIKDGCTTLIKYKSDKLLEIFYAEARSGTNGPR